jgi:hypothetical protein
MGKRDQAFEPNAQSQVFFCVKTFLLKKEKDKESSTCIHDTGPHVLSRTADNPFFINRIRNSAKQANEVFAFRRTIVNIDTSREVTGDYSV